MIRTVLRGLGQIMLQESAITGAFFLAGIAYISPWMALAAVLASFIGTVTARVFRFPIENVQKGLYGFSAALVGVALLLFFKSSVLIWGLIVVGAALAALLQQGFMILKIPAFTLPFVLVTWLILFIFLDMFSLPANVPDETVRPLNWDFPLIGYGQVIFQGGVVSGTLFFIGVLLRHGRSAVFGLVGAILGGAFAWGLGLNESDIAIGLFSFNGVLCAIAFTGTKPQDTLLAFVSVMITVPISMLFFDFGLPQLTFPFVASTMICLGFQKLRSKFRRKAISRP